jgi:hypothetical protein
MFLCIYVVNKFKPRDLPTIPKIKNHVSMLTHMVIIVGRLCFYYLPAVIVSNCF